MSSSLQLTHPRDIFLKHESISLRPFQETDIPIWAQWFNNPNITQFMNKGFYPNDEEKQHKYFEALIRSESDIQLAVILNHDHRLIGSVGLHKIDWVHRTGEISVLIGELESWGKGYGTIAVGLLVRHAFEKLNLRKLSAGMWNLNLGSEACFVKNAFQLEGRRREQFHFQGDYIDELCYGLLRSEWLSGLRLGLK